MPEIWRFAPASPYMNISPPMTIATSANDRARGPVKVAARLPAARSHGDVAVCANAIVGRATMRAAASAPVRRALTRRGLPDMTPSRDVLHFTPNFSCEHTDNDIAAELIDQFGFDRRTRTDPGHAAHHAPATS